MSSNYEPPIDMTGEHPVAVDRQIERSEEEDDYHLPLADSEEDDFKLWDMHNEVVVATDEEVQREDNQNKQGKNDRQENSDKEVATGTSAAGGGAPDDASAADSGRFAATTARHSGVVAPRPAPVAAPRAVPVAVGAGAVLMLTSSHDTPDEALAQVGRRDIGRGGGGWYCLNSVCAEFNRLGQPQEQSALLKQVGGYMHDNKRLLVELGLIDYGGRCTRRGDNMSRLAAHIQKMMNPAKDTDTWFTGVEICALSEVVKLPLFVLIKRNKWQWEKYSGFAMIDMDEGKGMSAKRLTLDISDSVKPTIQDIGIISHSLVHFTQSKPLSTHDSIIASNTSAATTVAGPMIAPPPPPAAGTGSACGEVEVTGHAPKLGKDEETLGTWSSDNCSLGSSDDSTWCPDTIIPESCKGGSSETGPP